jgi:hypothetical protein
MPPPSAISWWPKDGCLVQRRCGLILLHEELAQLNGPYATTTMRDALVGGITEFQDSQMLDPAIAEIANVRPASITNGIAPTTGTGDLSAQVAALLGALHVSRPSAAKPVLVLSPALAGQLAATGNHPQLTVSGGTAFGVPTVCKNATKLSIATLDAAVLLKLSGEVLRPKAEKAIIDGLVAELAPRTVAKDAARRRKELATLDQEIARLTEAIAMTGCELPPLVEALRNAMSPRRTLAADMQETDVSRLDPAGLGQRVRDRFTAWRADPAGPLPTKRKLLREILTGPLLLTPGERAYTFEGEIAAERLLTGEIGLPTNLVRPAGLEPATPGLGNRCSILLSYGRNL